MSVISVMVFCPQKFLPEGRRDEDVLARLLPRLPALGQRQVGEGEAKQIGGQPVNTV